MAKTGKKQSIQSRYRYFYTCKWLGVWDSAVVKALAFQEHGLRSSSGFDQSEVLSALSCGWLSSLPQGVLSGFLFS